MKNTSLENKTVRPGMGLDTYTGFYRTSDSKKPAKKKSKNKQAKAPTSKSWLIKLIILVAIVIAAGYFYDQSQKAPQKFATKLPEKKAVSATAKPTPAQSAPVVAPVAVDESKPCKGNSLSKMALISISKRHLWACEGTKQVYSSPVITGMEKLEADKTPTGTFKIYSKQKDVTLTGSDTTGSWNDPVSYWMPYLSNQYGVYGFHDATWRASSEFGNIDPYSDKGSHGCVELTLGAAAWIYNWAPLETTVIVEA